MDRITLPSALVRFATEAIAAGRYRNLDEVLALLVRVESRLAGRDAAAV